MRLVAWNIRSGGGQRAAGIVDQLRRWRPELVLLREFRDPEPSGVVARARASAGLDHQRSTARPERPVENALLLASRWPLRRLSLARQPPVGSRGRPGRVAAPPPLGSLSVGG